MAMFVNTNVSALNGQRNLQNVTDRMNSSFEKLSSGSRINSARDDAAGLQISDRLTTQINGLQQGNRNANDGISIAQIAEGALSEVTTNVQRMRQLVVQGGNRTLSADDRSALANEFDTLLKTNNQIADRTAYGTQKLLNGDSPSSGFQIQSGAQSGQQDTVTTGNATLSGMFGDILANEEILSGSTVEFGNMDDTNLSEYGTLGKIVAAYIAVGAGSSGTVDAAMCDLFGLSVGGGLTLIGSTLSNFNDLAVDSKQKELQASALTALLEGKAALDASDVAADLCVVLGNNVSNVLGFAGSDLTECVLTDAQLDTVNAFVTDTLLDLMSDMVSQVDRQRAKLGAEQNGLASTVRSNSAAIVNVSDSRARITDTDFATETAELTRNQIIQQAATTILSQANQLPNAALSLLR